MYSVLYVQCTVCTVYCMYSVLYVQCTVCTVYCMYSVLYVQCTVRTVYCTYSVLYVQRTVRTAYVFPHPPSTPSPHLTTTAYVLLETRPRNDQVVWAGVATGLTCALGANLCLLAVVVYAFCRLASIRSRLNIIVHRHLYFWTATSGFLIDTAKLSYI